MQKFSKASSLPNLSTYKKYRDAFLEMSFLHTHAYTHTIILSLAHTPAYSYMELHASTLHTNIKYKYIQILDTNSITYNAGGFVFVEFVI